MDHLNVFSPYDNKPLDHEDQLTRALLILIKDVKPIELAFTDMLIDEMGALGCEQIPTRLTMGAAGVDEVKTQVWSTTHRELHRSSGRLVSVLLTDKRLKPEHLVERTERIAVYDGIIHYKPDWVFVLENKPDSRNVWVDQLNSAFSESFEIERRVVVLRWQEVIARISTVKENGLLHGAEETLADDFLDFVANRFPELNPYDRFELCKGNEYLLNRRCIAVMEESELGPVDYHRGWHHYIQLGSIEGAKQIALFARVIAGDEWEVCLQIYPGDTMSQARYFYSKVDPSRVLALEGSGWHIRPNFHFAFRSSNLVWTSPECSVAEYLGYWIDRVRRGELRQISRGEWDNYLLGLQSARMLSPEDKQNFAERIGNTEMQRINVCPGIAFVFTWSQSQATSLDSERRFLSSFKERVRECISTWTFDR